MAALSEYPAVPPEILDLQRISGRALDPLLLEETVEWQRELDWDFSKSAEMVRHYVDTKGLNGCVLLDRHEVVGYGYAVLEDHKGLVGDIYLRPAWRGRTDGLRLFLAVFDELTQSARVRRVESQLMLLDRDIARDAAAVRKIELYERLLMSLDLVVPVAPHSSQKSAMRRFHIEPWAEHHYEAAAGVIATAYAGHIDGRINDQYRSLAGARRFLYNIVQFPGCGAFSPQGSLIAFDPATGFAAGVVLVSFVGPATGHITQICVTPAARHTGLGYELLRQAVAFLRLHGAKRVSLTVTAGNDEAISLYTRCGFRDIRRFFACVWDR